MAHKATLELTIIERQVYEKRQLGLKFEQIAEELGKTNVSVRNHYTKAVSKLQRQARLDETPKRKIQF